MRYLDTNVLIRYFTRDDREKAEAALALLLRVERGEERVAISPLVVFETVFTLQRSYSVPRGTIRDLVLPLLRLRGLDLPAKSVFERALSLYAIHSVSFADAYSAAYMESRGLSELYSWDADFDRFPGITRLEPGLP